MREKLAGNRRFFRLLTWALMLPYLANTTGWLLTELGRQPWIVQGLQKTEDAVSPNVSQGSVLFSLIAFTLMVADVYLLMKYGKAGPVDEASEDALHTAAA